MASKLATSSSSSVAVGERAARTTFDRARVLARTAATSDTSDATNGICHRARCYLYLFQLRVRVVVAEIVADFFFSLAFPSPELARRFAVQRRP